MHLVFVYGTLKRGEFFNKIFLKKSKFISEGTVKGKLVFTGRCSGAPGLLPGDATVHGEIFSVDDDTLDDLDFLEGTKRQRYDRREVEVSTPSGAVVCHTYFYLQARGDESVIESGNFTDPHRRKK